MCDLKAKERLITWHLKFNFDDEKSCIGKDFKQANNPYVKFEKMSTCQQIMDPDG